MKNKEYRRPQNKYLDDNNQKHTLILQVLLNLKTVRELPRKSKECFKTSWEALSAKKQRRGIKKKEHLPCSTTPTDRKALFIDIKKDFCPERITRAAEKVRNGQGKHGTRSI